MTAAARVPPTTGRLVAGAALLAAALAAVVLLRSADDPALTGQPGIAPVRVASGGEVATGFAVGRDRVVTVAHVLEGAVRVAGVRAQVLRVDRRSDLALLAVRGGTGRSPAASAIVGRSPASAGDEVRIASAGDEVRVVVLRNGRSSARSVRMRRAIVAHVRAAGAEQAVTRPALELAARVRDGDSGAPVLARSGALVGVVFAASSRRENTAYAVDASAVARLLGRD
jgi:S1-C subfamily serine protease